ncbi:MAG TPA: hypothetical protein PKM68_04080 [Bacillota bacterium]|nr:hypothetical protein [Bacillota bacterium]
MKRAYSSILLGFVILALIFSVPGYTQAVSEVVPDTQVETIKIVNDTGYSLYHLYISPSTSMEWGEDLLGDTEVITYGAVFDTGIPISPIEYDVCCIDHEGDAYYKWGVGIKRQPRIVLSFMDLDLEGLASTSPLWSGASAGSVQEAGLLDTIKIVNNTGYTIYHLYVSPATSSSWGDDLLGFFGIIEDGEEYDTGIPADATLYNIRLVDSDGDSYTQWDVDVSRSSTVQFTIWDIDLDSETYAEESTELALTIFNATGSEIKEIYISPGDSTSWGPNKLESGAVIPDRGSFDDILTGPQTVYDLKLVDSDDRTYIKWDVDLSENEWLVFTVDDLFLL